MKESDRPLRYLSSAPTRQINLSSSLKRCAWAYGCAKKGSEEEERLRVLLLAKTREEAP